MAFLNKSFIIITILVACMLANVFATKVDTENAKFCKNKKNGGLELANGVQNKKGSCSKTFMGEIPNFDRMVSTAILSPKDGEVITENKAFTIKAQILNLVTGFFSDPALTYYEFPQALDNSGRIQGHSHVTIQKLNGNGAPDPRVFAFFKGLNEKAVKGVLSADVEKGLPAGKYRLCTMSSAFSHQPVLMPVAQRGNYLNKHEFLFTV